MVILIFIFLTPKSWFTSGELAPGSLHQSRIVTTVLLSPEVVANEGDKAQIEQRIKAMTGRQNVEVLQVRRIPGADGRTLSFEVDFR